MFDQPQEFTLREEPARPQEMFSRHFEEYNRRWHEAMNHCNGMALKAKQFENDGYCSQENQLEEETVSSNGMNLNINTISDIVHIKIQNSNLYVQRDLLTAIPDSKLAKVFSQNLMEFELVRDPTVFQLMLEYLRKKKEISRLKLQSHNDVHKLNEELGYWGISLAENKSEEQNQPQLNKFQLGQHQSGTQEGPLCNLSNLVHQNQTSQFPLSSDQKQFNYQVQLKKSDKPLIDDVSPRPQTSSPGLLTVHQSKISLLSEYQNCCMKMLQSQSMLRELHQLDRAHELQQEQIIPGPYTPSGGKMDMDKREQIEHLVTLEQRMAYKMKQIKKQIDLQFNKQENIISEQKSGQNIRQKPIQTAPKSEECSTIEPSQTFDEKPSKSEEKENKPETVRIIRRRKSRGFIKCEHREEKHYSNGMCKRCYHKKYFKEKVQKSIKDKKSQSSQLHQKKTDLIY